MVEMLLGLLTGLALVDTVILAYLWCRLTLPAAARREETAQEAAEDESKRSEEMAAAIENLMQYSVGSRGGADRPEGGGE